MISILKENIMKFKTESEIFEELYESIYSGNVDSDDSEEKDESEEETEEKVKKPETSEKEESSEAEDDEESEGEDDKESEDEDDKESEGGSKNGGGDKGGPFTSKIRSLQKQYNDLLVDAFEKYAPECIEDALDETESAFGENIENILQNALDKLKGKIMGDLGVEGSAGVEGMMPPAAMGSFDPAAGADNPMEIRIDKIG